MTIGVKHHCHKPKETADVAVNLLLSNAQIHKIVARFVQEVQSMASTLAEGIAEVRASVDAMRKEAAAALDRVSVDVAELLKRIQEGATPASALSDLSSIKTDIDAVTETLKTEDPLADFPAPIEPPVEPPVV